MDRSDKPASRQQQSTQQQSTQQQTSQQHYTTSVSWHPRDMSSEPARQVVRLPRKQGVYESPLCRESHAQGQLDVQDDPEFQKQVLHNLFHQQLLKDRQLPGEGEAEEEEAKTPESGGVGEGAESCVGRRPIPLWHSVPQQLQSPLQEHWRSQTQAEPLKQQQQQQQQQQSQAFLSVQRGQDDGSSRPSPGFTAPPVQRSLSNSPSSSASSSPIRAPSQPPRFSRPQSPSRSPAVAAAAVPVARSARPPSPRGLSLSLSPPSNPGVGDGQRQGGAPPQRPVYHRSKSFQGISLNRHLSCANPASEASEAESSVPAGSGAGKPGTRSGSIGSGVGPAPRKARRPSFLAGLPRCRSFKSDQDANR